MTGRLGDQDAGRIARTGLRPMAIDRCLRLLDAALSSSAPALVAAEWDVAVLREQARSGALPPILEPIAGQGRRGPDRGAGRVRFRLSGLDRGEGRKVLVDLVRTQTALVLGVSSKARVGTEQAFKDAGFDSLTAVDLRNRLSRLTGLALAATLVFDFPTPAALADHLLERLVPARDPGEPAADEPRIRKLLAEIPLGRLREVGMLDGLLRLATPLDAGGREAAGATDEAIDALDSESLVRMVRQTLDQR